MRRCAEAANSTDWLSPARIRRADFKLQDVAGKDEFFCIKWSRKYSAMCISCFVFLNAKCKGPYACSGRENMLKCGSINASLGHISGQKIYIMCSCTWENTKA